MFYKGLTERYDLRKSILDMPAPIEQIQIDRETIGHVLRDGRKLYVPTNQRSYAWKEEHVTDLYQDLARAIREGEDEYFLGSIVVVASGKDRLEVNDGQQRLATSLILIGAIRDYFSRKGDTKTSGGIERDFLLTYDRKTHELNPRLHLNADDHNFFLTTVINPPDETARKAAAKTKPVKDSHRRILKASQVAAKHVKEIGSELSEADKATELHKWLEFLEQGARIIWVQVSDERTAYIIFETMNDRGLKLSAADLLKNYIFGKAEDRREEAILKWQTMSGIWKLLEKKRM
jgi:uncharacterized protein with ParB-like and HNH nuclease domain